MFFRPEHERWIGRLERFGRRVVEVEHFRIKKARVFDHVAVVVATNFGQGDGGSCGCWVGEAKVGKLDCYSRKLGYRIAVGRALKGTAFKVVDFYVQEEVVREGGLVLRDFARKNLIKLGFELEDRNV